MTVTVKRVTIGLVLRKANLRERKKAATMRHTQLVAVRLFAERGFDAVSIEQVAAAADVSPSTIYRYFGTKEGLVLHDEHDDGIFAMVPKLLHEQDLLSAFLVGLDQIGTAHLRDPETVRLRTALWFSTPSVRAAGYLLADDIVDALVDDVLASPRNDLSRSQARTVIGALIGGLFASMRSWIEDGGTDDIRARMSTDLGAIAQALHLNRT